MRLIDAVTAAEIISKKMNIPLAELVDVFAEIPDANEPKKGKWEKHVDNMPYPKFDDTLVYHCCSSCKKWSIRLTKCSEYSFCPHCGAKMEGENNEAN